MQTALVMKDGQPVTDVWVSAHTVTGEEKWFNGKTDENGKFSTDLTRWRVSNRGNLGRFRIEMVS